MAAPFGAKGLGWLGYLLDPFGFGGKTGTWAFANLGVPIALAIGFVGYLLFGARAVRRQEREPVARLPTLGAVVCHRSCADSVGESPHRQHPTRGGEGRCLPPFPRRFGGESPHRPAPHLGR